MSYFAYSTTQRQFLVMVASLVMLATGCKLLSSTPIPERTGLPNEVHVGSLRRVSQPPYVLEPHIAVNPMNPDHLAAVVASVSEFDFSGDGVWKLVLYTSMDGGITWQEQIPFERSVTSGDGVVAFGPDGTLYVTGLGGSAGGVFTVWANAEGKMSLSTTRAVTSMPGNDKPWLTIDPHDGTLYVPYDGPTREQFENHGIVLAYSTDGGKTWIEPVTIHDPGVNWAAIAAGQALSPSGAQLMLGEGSNVSVAWMWSPGMDNWPAGLGVATSNDKGQTFSTPRQIAEAWGYISTASHNGVYYIFYRRGTEQAQELVVAISQDQGATWTTSLVSGEIDLYFDFDKAPGVNVAPNGTIDVMFYAHGEGAPDCIDMAAIRRRREQGWVDQCVYNVYYTLSRDGGETFLTPIKLNNTPIVGSRFVRVRGVSKPGEYMGMASTDKYAYPVWIDTQSGEGTQVYTVQIER